MDFRAMLQTRPNPTEARIFALPHGKIDACAHCPRNGEARRWAGRAHDELCVGVGVKRLVCYGPLGSTASLNSTGSHWEATDGPKCFPSGIFLLNQMEPCQAPPPHTATQDSLTGPF